ncbi:aldo/keto reductase [Streptomyces sp. NPDC056628]|uniref:aldo/keto reductase n=1 Tax=Streptomyces sp. NPDC056628 TaxID=3345882 RepID=UPI0036A89540
MPQSTSPRLFPLGGDLPVSRIGYGAMRLFGADHWGPYPDEKAAIELLRGVVDAGVNLIDTADVYGPHSNETLIHDALAPYAPGVVIATKGGFVRPGPGMKVTPVGNPDYLRQSVHLSARRLGIEHIDLYYLHSAWATDASFEDQVGTLAELRDQGLVRHIGLSNLTAEQLKAAQAITSIAAVTAHYSVAARANHDLLEATLASGAAFVPWQPISLTTPGDPIDTTGPAHLQQVLAPIAEAHGATIPQVSLAWLLGIAPGVLPIPATTSLDHFRENLGALDLTLTPQERSTIDGLATP